MRVVSCSFKLLNITAEVAYGTFCIFGILVSVLFDILLNRSPSIQIAFLFRIFCKLYTPVSLLFAFIHLVHVLWFSFPLL